jgi:hypothetical protein
VELTSKLDNQGKTNRKIIKCGSNPEGMSRGTNWTQLEIKQNRWFREGSSMGKEGGTIEHSPTYHPNPSWDIHNP